MHHWIMKIAKKIQLLFFKIQSLFEKHDALSLVSLTLVSLMKLLKLYN